MRIRIAIALGVLCSQLSFGQFTNLGPTNQMSLINNNPLFGNAACFVDFDDDGHDDITYGTKHQSIQFWKNDGANGFDLMSYSFSPAIASNIDIKAVIWFDYDNDGDKDIAFSAILNNGLGNYPMKLYNNNGNMEFTDVSLSAGILPETPQIFGISAGDYNNDGWLDLYVCKYHNPNFYSGYMYSNRLYRNNGDGTFSDVTISAGLPTPIQASFCSAFFDYDRDGHQDIIVVNDRFQYYNYLYHNKGDGTFEDLSFYSGIGIYIEAMSSTVGDYDHDGDQDVFISNTLMGNVLMNNQGNGTFVDYAPAAGVTTNKVCWGSLWLDYDNDSWEDLFVPSVGSGVTVSDANKAYKNLGNGTFSDVTATLGLTANNDGTYTMAMGDYNSDGYYDFIQNNTVTATDFYSNNGGDNHYLCTTYEGVVSNKDGIGTWIDCWAGGIYQNKYTLCGENYICQNSEKEIFGLGDATLVDSLKIFWLSGIEETYYNIDADQCLHFIEGASFANFTVSVSYEEDLFICPGDSIVFEAEPGYSYLWNNGSTESSVTIYEPETVFATFTNSYGYEQTSSEYIVQWAPDLDYTASSTMVSCVGYSDATAEISTDQAQLTSVQWVNSSNTELQIDSLSIGTHYFLLTDIYGCLYLDSVMVGEPDSLSMVINYSDALCFGEGSGMASATVGGGNGEPYNVFWGEGIDPNALAAGEYSLIGTDNLGCAISQNYIINQPTELSGNITTNIIDEENPTASANLVVEGGTPPYSTIWSGGEIDLMEVDNLPSGFGYVIISDANNCSLELTFEILVSVHEMNLESMMLVYPNPAVGLVQISSDKRFDQIRMYNVSGEICQLIRLSPTLFATLEINSVLSGTYLIEISIEDNAIAREILIIH